MRLITSPGDPNHCSSDPAPGKNDQPCWREAIRKRRVNCSTSRRRMFTGSGVSTQTALPCPGMQKFLAALFPRQPHPGFSPLPQEKRNDRQLKELTHWMEEHEYESIRQMRGSVSHRSVSDPAAFERGN